MISKTAERWLGRLEAAAAATGPKPPLILEARDPSGAWTAGDGGRWVDASGMAYTNADVERRAATHFLVMVCQSKANEVVV